MVAGFGGVTFTKNLGDFSLNAANLWKSIFGTGKYFQDSVPEQWATSIGASDEAVRAAAAANLTWDLASGKVPGKVVVSTGTRLNPTVPALFQTPLRATIEAQALT